MPLSNRDRVRAALDLVKAGLAPYVDREMARALGPGWLTSGNAGLQDVRGPALSSIDQTDTPTLLNLVITNWHNVFSSRLAIADRDLCHGLRNARNAWAHERAISTDDAYRALDDAARLMAAISAGQQVAELERMKDEALRQRYEERTRQESRRVAAAPVEGRPSSGLKPWREIVTPHQDVASGRYQQAEFAADLAQVHRGEGGSEYRVPRDFFQRTFLTQGLSTLLGRALQRLGGSGGDPVVKLQTNFGGGKTHSMLALYHLFSGVTAAELPGLEPILMAVGLEQPPRAARAVLVGSALSPGQPRQKPDGTTVRTLWGELAWQLGRAEAYELVAEADRTGVNPGSEALAELFEMWSPCLVLIDEWVTYARQLYNLPEPLPAGTFEANLSFAQSITEAARAAPKTLLVASIPSSDIEVGGEAGRQALAMLEHTFARVESSWSPASTDEGFEIVRRRLFEPVHDHVGRDAVVRAFAELYRANGAEFPPGCGEREFERRMQASYPIHPELFARLFEDWSALERFQRTRGVLRLMALVIHFLWERGERGLMIQPSSIPIDAPDVQDELIRYLDPVWRPIIERDVDGPNSLPLRIDVAQPNFGRYSAARRVARTLYFGSAPNVAVNAAQRGLDDRQVKLGCAQPGETVATFGDALRRLTDQATFLYVDRGRSWYGTQPSVTRLASDRAEQLERDGDTVHAEIVRRLRTEQAQARRGDFARVHVCPASHGDVPDEPEARLVILGPEYAHGRGADDATSPARREAATLLEQRGTGPRRYRNALVFLAADRARLAELEQAVRQYLAWKSIAEERETLNLDAHQTNQVRTRHQQSDETVAQRIPETYCWLLAPDQPDKNGAVEWNEHRLSGDDPLAVRAGRRLRSDGALVLEYGAVNLRMELDRVPLWREGVDHVAISQLRDDYATYPYLPRLRDADVLLTAIRDGVGRLTAESDAFAYAEGWDEVRQRYLGLRMGSGGSVTLDGGTLLVKPAAARRQFDADEAARQGTGSSGGGRPSSGPGDGRDGGGEPSPGPGGGAGPEPAVLRRFHGAVTIDPLRMSTQSQQIAEAVVQHLASLLGGRVRVTLEIEAELPDGAPDHVVRTVTENCRTLRFDDAGFEER